MNEFLVAAPREETPQRSESCLYICIQYAVTYQTTTRFRFNFFPATRCSTNGCRFASAFRFPLLHTFFIFALISFFFLILFDVGYGPGVRRPQHRALRRAQAVAQRLVLPVGRVARALHVAALAADGLELPALVHHGALAKRVHSQARDLHALVHVEVDLLVVRLGADRARALGVPQHEVGVRARRDGALAREDVEDLGGVG
mmetsp:Transcript_10612/g.26009  ORF Transcript_10612/g.26009 Transcript_10612/m.26009 type:complete len:202 (+) Transcript_10612:25-630(+)